MPKPRKQLTLTDAKKLSRFIGRPDQPLVMQTRVWLLEQIWNDRQWFYDQLKGHVMFGSRETEPATKVLMKLLDKITPDLRESAIGEATPQAPTANGLTVKIYNVNRGTRQARERAIEVGVQRRKALESRVPA